MMRGDTGPGFPGGRCLTCSHDAGTGRWRWAGVDICYGIVREHGGISAFNLHQRAAVVVELPIDRVVREEAVVVGEVA